MIKTKFNIPGVFKFDDPAALVYNAATAGTDKLRNLVGAIALGNSAAIEKKEWKSTSLLKVFLLKRSVKNQYRTILKMLHNSKMKGCLI